MLAPRPDLEPRDLALRGARTTDAEFILRLADDAFGHLGDYRRLLGDLLWGAGVETLLVTSEEVPVGFAMVAALERGGFVTADLLALVVEPSWRRRGVGRWLLRRSVERATTLGRRSGAVRIGLDVAAENAPALSLFGAEGFAHRPELDQIYPSGAPGLRMVRALEEIP